jgi:hypothetical protein
MLASTPARTQKTILTLAQLKTHIAEDQAFTTNMAYLPAGNTLKFEADSSQICPKTLGKIF